MDSLEETINTLQQYYGHERKGGTVTDWSR